MKKQIPMEFITRQYMDSREFELFYYSDSDTPIGKVALHTHDFYELYFFLEGDVPMKSAESLFFWPAATIS